MHYNLKSVLSVKLNIHLIFNWQLNTNSTTPLRNLKHGNDVMISAFCGTYSIVYERTVSVWRAREQYRVMDRQSERERERKSIKQY